MATSKGRSSTAKAAKQKERTTTILGSHAELGPGPCDDDPWDGESNGTGGLRCIPKPKTFAGGRKG